MWEQLKNELTFHTAIEILAIIFAAVVVHPLTSLVPKSFKKFEQIIAASNKSRAKKRTERLLKTYSRLWHRRNLFENQPYAAALVSASENMRFVLLCTISIVIGEVNTISVGIALLILFVVYNIWLNLTSARRDVINFEKFRTRTQDELISLRPTIEDDGWLAEQWRRRFQATAPFIADP